MGHLPDELNGLLQQEHHNQRAQIQAEITYFNQTKAFYVEFICVLLIYSFSYLWSIVS